MCACFGGILFGRRVLWYADTSAHIALSLVKTDNDVGKATWEITCYFVGKFLHVCLHL